MRYEDGWLAEDVVKWIFNPDRLRPAEALVVCDTKASADWVMRQVQHPTAAKRIREDCLGGEDGTQIYFRAPTGREICGRSYDKIFFSGNVPLRIWWALKPCEL